MSPIDLSLRVLLVTAALLTGCSTPLAQLRLELGPMAESDLECPEKKLTYRELAHVITSTRVRVSGCKREVEYEMLESRWHKVPSAK